MAVKVGKFLEKMAKKVGQDTTAEVFKPLLELDADIPDEIAALMDTNLLTVEAAKSNSEVNKALRQSILGVADSKMDDILKEIKVIPGDDFLKEKNTYEKLNMLSKMIYNAGQKKAAIDNQAGVHETLKKEKQAFEEKEKEFQKQFAEYQRQLKSAQELQEAKEKDYNSKLENNSINYDLYKKLLGKKFDLPEKMDVDLKVQTALLSINNELEKRGLSIKRGDGRELGLFDKDGKPGYSEDHNLLKLDSFIDGVLAQNNLLKINDGGNGQNQNQNQNQNGATFIPSNGGNGNAAIVADIDAQLAEFSKM